MKKAVFSVLMALIMILSAACSPAANNTSNVPANNTEPGNNTDPQTPGNTVEPEDKDQERYEALYENGIHNTDDLAFFLNGTWSMLPEGAQPGTVQEFADITFDYSSRKAVFELKLGGPAKAELAFTSDKLYADMPDASEDIIQFFITSADSKLKENAPNLVGSSAKYQIFFSRWKDYDLMLLRTYGLYPSEMTFGMFNDTNYASDYCLVFCRQGGTKSKKAIDDKFYQDNRYFNVTFMALKWVDLEGVCYLQPVNFEYFKESLYDQEEDFVRFGYSKKNSMYCLKYETEGSAQEKGTAAFEPQLVEVTVNGDSKITEIHRYQYADNGIYYHKYVEPGPSGDPDKRDPAVYGATDAMYLGSWTDKANSKNTLVINEASPQTGGYKLDFLFGDVVVNGYANIAEDNALFINQGYVNGNIRIEGVIQKTGDGIQFLVTACDWTAAPAGTTFNYVKAGSEGEGPNGGEGSEYRDPEKYGFCDWFFPKTWYLRDDHKKTLKVTVESIQAGGYKVVFTTPDGAKAECYGHPEDGYLIIHQGTINGKYSFTGYLSQVDEVFMHLFITDSNYKSLPVGTKLVYDPKK